MKTVKTNICALKLLWTFSRAYFPLMIVSSLFCNLSPYFNVYLSAEIINEIVGGRNKQTLIVLIMITILGNCIISVFSGFLSKLFVESELRQSHAEECYFLQKYLNMDYSDFENPTIRQLRRKIIESAKINNHGKQLLLNSIKRITDAVINIVIGLLLIIELFVAGFHKTSWYVSVLFCVAFLVLLTANVLYHLRISKRNAVAANEVSKTMIDNNRVDNAIEGYNAGKDIRIYRQDLIIMNIKNNRLLMHRKAFDDFSRYQFKSTIPLLFLTIVLNAILTFYIVINALAGSFGAGSIIKYFGISNKLVESILSVFRSVTDIKTNANYIAEYLSFFDIPNKMQIGTQSVGQKVAEPFVLEFKNVSFKYPGADNYAICNINLRILSGTKLGIVGQNGSGKTTFIKLLCRLYDPTEGEIVLNGINIKEYKYNEYLQLLSVVFQDFKLFSFSLGTNIAGKTDYNTQLVEECLIKVGFGERYSMLELGVNTCLYQDFDANGIEISGGEAQKVALARALYKRSPIIVLDEPTAALDPIAEAEIYTQFCENVINKTVIFISHRLSSCKYCESIIVLDKGSIVQKGTHQELLAEPKGKYHALWVAQAQYYKPED